MIEYLLVMGSNNSKAAILEEILKIEDEIRRIKKDSTYLSIRRNLRNLESIGFGNPTLTIPSPDDLDVHMMVPRRSSEMKDIISRYRERRSEYEDRISRLFGRRKRLEEELFG
jgi:hypothetical protein